MGYIAFIPKIQKHCGKASRKNKQEWKKQFTKHPKPNFMGF
jgi:hypothetical protein